MRRRAGDRRSAWSGWGNAGSWLAIILEELGYPIVAVSDSRGAVFSADGLPARDVLAHKRETGSVIDFPGADTLPCEHIFSLDCAVLVLAALEESVDEGNADRVKAQVTELMGAATDQVMTRAESEALTFREAAYVIGVGRVAEAEVARGFR